MDIVQVADAVDRHWGHRAASKELARAGSWYRLLVYDAFEVTATLSGDRLTLEVVGVEPRPLAAERFTTTPGQLAATLASMDHWMRSNLPGGYLAELDALTRRDRELTNERVNEDLQLKVVRGTPRYEFRAQGPVHFAPIRRDRDGASEILGYLWFSDDESAAGYVADQRLSPESDNLGMIWIEHLSRAKAEGLSPSAAADSFGALPSGPAGRLAITELSTAPALDALRVIAGFTR